MCGCCVWRRMSGLLSVTCIQEFLRRVELLPGRAGRIGRHGEVDRRLQAVGDTCVVREVKMSKRTGAEVRRVRDDKRRG